jgi:hypothetical protein
MAIYIKSPTLGRFIGEFIGLGMFEASIEAGDCSPDEKPIEFPSVTEAQTYLDSWVGGPADCVVVEE